MSTSGNYRYHMMPALIQGILHLPHNNPSRELWNSVRSRFHSNICVEKLEATNAKNMSHQKTTIHEMALK